ncbi:hypothetical protein HAX54_003854 [Datura stramonium]|uniref:Uncharacterized protein n=1 Tax=Datura stramonium TaxID=4076 RepID=A0ABS8T759_DATST|nr:hypothetical protein [Datura stramonium]
MALQGMCSKCKCSECVRERREKVLYVRSGRLIGLGEGGDLMCWCIGGKWEGVKVGKWKGGKEGNMGKWECWTNSYLDQRCIDGSLKHNGVPPLYLYFAMYLYPGLYFSVGDPPTDHKLDRQFVGDPPLRR